MKTIMILGAGTYQVPLIEKAKKRGLKTVVVSPMGSYPGIRVADVFVELDTTDKSSILEAAISNKVDGILTTGTDVAVPSVGHVVDNLNLHGTGYEASCKCTDKTLMKKCLYEAGVNTAEFFVVLDLKELQIRARQIGYPVIVKATDTSGSRGVTKVGSELGLQDAFVYAKSVSKVNDVIVEKYLDGYEMGAQAVVYNNKLEEVFIHSDIVTPSPVSAPIGHGMPLNLSDNLTAKIKLIIGESVSALNINNTIANVDIMIVDDEPFILEIGARMGATCLPENISLYSGTDAYDLILKMALGEDIALPSLYKEQANAALIIKAEKSGIVKFIDVSNDIFTSERLVNFCLDVVVGDRVKAFKVGPDRIGQIITTGESYEASIALAYEIEKSIVLEIDDE